MERRNLTPKQWRAMSKSERVELLAYEHIRDERRARMLEDVRDKFPENEFSMLGQLLVILGD